MTLNRLVDGLAQRGQPHAVFTGFYTGASLARHYASGDIYLHTSTTETFGNVVTEALGSGLAVAAFDYAAAHEFIRSGDNGLLAPLDDEAAFLANAVRLADEPALRRRLAAAGPATVRELSWDTIVEHFAADLQEAADEFHSARISPPSTSPLRIQPSAPTLS